MRNNDCAALERWLADGDDIARLLHAAGIPKLGIYYAEARTPDLPKGRRHVKVVWKSESKPVPRTYLEVETPGTDKRFSPEDFDFFEPVQFKEPAKA